MGRLFYATARTVSRGIRFCTMTLHRLGQERIPLDAGYVLACSHQSHFDPPVLTATMPHKVDWMAREEFFRTRFSSWFLHRMDSFRVDRRRVCTGAVRTAIDRCKAGRAIGVFTEGFVARKEQCAFRGGPIKRGACLISMRAQRPIVPCIILGTPTLSRVAPWLPFRRSEVWLAFGKPMSPPPRELLHRRNRRAERFAMAEQLTAEFVRLYAEARAEFGIEDGDVP